MAYGPSFDLQAFLLERTSGVPYGKYFQEYVLDPLQLDETRYYLPEQAAYPSISLVNSRKARSSFS